MAGLTSAHFTLIVRGKLPDLKVQGAAGDLTSVGDARGTAKMTQFEQLVEVDFVVVGKVLYLKGATGGFTKLPAALAGEVYDPTAILQAEKGVAAVLRHIITPGNPTLVGSSYTITGTVPKAAAAALVPGITSDAMGTFTIDRASSRLTDVVLHLAGSDGKPAAVDLALSDFNKAVTASTKRCSKSAEHKRRSSSPDTSGTATCNTKSKRASTSSKTSTTATTSSASGAPANSPPTAATSKNAPCSPCNSCNQRSSTR